MADRITVLGIDGRDPATPCALVGADLAVGGRRHLDGLADGKAGVPTLSLDGDLDGVAERIATTTGHVVVLASGDPGVFGITRWLAERFGRDTLHVVPAVSSATRVCAAAGVPADDAVVVSAHGRDPRTAVATCRAHPKVVVLTDPSCPPADLAERLQGAGVRDRRVVVAERLGHDDERVREVDLDTATALHTADPNVVLVLDPDRAVGPRPVLGGVPAGGPPGGWALSTDAFGHRDGMVSKPEVRAVALAHLAPATGRTCWDVGTGSGAVAVECARFGAAVDAVDHDADAVVTTRANADRHGVAVQVHHGRAPEVLAGLEDPDAVFVGGGGTVLEPILATVAERARDRVVVALATVERVRLAVDVLAGAGWHTDAQLLQAADLAPLGDGHRLAPRNPVWLVRGAR